MEELTTDSLATLSEVFSASRLGGAAMVLAATYFALRVLALIIARIGARAPRYRLVLNRTLPVVRFFVWVSAIYIVVAHVLSPPRETLLGLAASAGLALGLAAQDLVKNVISGLLILFEQPFQIGDIVEIEGVEGEVISIGLRAVLLRTFDDSTVTIPNGRLFENLISNANTGALRQQVTVEFQLPAHVDIVEVKKLAREAAETSPYAWLGGPISVLVEDRFERTFLTRFSLRAYVIEIRLQRVFRSELIERIRSESLRRGWIDEAIVLGALGAGLGAEARRA